MSNVQEGPSIQAVYPMQKTVLIVEDDTAIAEMLVQTITEETPHRVLYASNAEQALNIMQKTQPNLLILNYRLPTTTGIELYDRATRHWGEIPAIMLSANLPRHEEGAVL